MNASGGENLAESNELTDVIKHEDIDNIGQVGVNEKGKTVHNDESSDNSQKKGNTEINNDTNIYEECTDDKINNEPTGNLVCELHKEIYIEFDNDCENLTVLDKQEKTDVKKTDDVKDVENESINNEQDKNCKVNEDTLKRINYLRDTLNGLRKELQEEKALWKKEIEEYDKICAQSMEHNFKTLNEHISDPNFLNDCKGYASSSVSSLSDNTKLSDPTVCDETIKEYEKKLARYEEALKRVHIEKRQQKCRLLAAQQYKKKLLEVEKLCNIELARVRQSASSLVPLNNMVMEWNLPPAEPYKGPNRLPSEFHIERENKSFSFTDLTSNNELQLLKDMHLPNATTDLNLPHVVAQISCPDLADEHMTQGNHKLQSDAIWQGDIRHHDQYEQLSNPIHIPRMPYTFSNN